MIYYLHGLICGQVTRDYGHGFKVTTFVGEIPLRHMLPTGVIPAANNDNDRMVA